MPVNIGPAGQNLELDFSRGNLEIRDERINDITLFPRTAQQKVDGNDLDHLDISMISGVDHAVRHFLNRDVVCNLVQRLNDIFFW